MVPENLNDIKENEYGTYGAYDYLRSIFTEAEKENMPYGEKEKSLAYVLLESLRQDKTVALILEDLIWDQKYIDVLSGSVYPAKYEDFINFLTDKRNKKLSPEEYNEKQLSYIDEKRLILLLYKAFQKRVEENRGQLTIKDIDEKKFDIADVDKNIINVNLTDKTIRDAYDLGSETNKSVDKVFRDYIDIVFANRDTSNVCVFATGIGGKQASKFQSYTYKEIMNNKAKKGKYLKFTKDTKDFIAKRLYPLDIEAVTSSVECGYRALFNVDLLSKYDRPTQEDIDKGRFDWLARNEGKGDYEIKEDSIVTEKIRDLLDDPNYVPYIDNKKFYAVVLYRTLNFLKNEAPKKQYAPEDLINFTIRLKGAYDGICATEKENNAPIIVFSKFKDEDSNDKTMQTVELNHEKLENYFYEELTDYVNVMINKDPENFIKIIKDSVYPFTVDELKCYLRLVQDSPETILYGYYKYNGINEKELFDILEDNDDLSIDKVILLILKKDLNKSGITNLNNILKAGGFTDKNIAGFLKGNYTLGNLTIDEVNQFRKEAFAKNPDIDVSLMEAKPKLLVKQFLILNKDIVFENLKKNDGFEERDFKELLSEYDFLNENYTKSQLEQIREDYNYNQALYVSNNLYKDEKALFEIENMLDTLIYSPSILKLLYNENIIDKDKGIELGGADFIRELQKDVKEQAPESEKKLLKSEKQTEVQTSSDITKREELKLLFKQSIRISKKDTKYSAKDFIKKYKEYEETLSYDEKEEFENEFREFQEELAKNGSKFYQDSLIELGRNRMLSKEFLSQIASKEQNYMNVIGALIADENTIDVSTLKYIFNDKFVSKAGYEENHRKRALLEKLFKTRYFSQDDKFLILMSVYGCHDENCEEIQRGFDSDNFQFFIDSQYLLLDAIPEESKEQFVKHAKSKNSNISNGKIRNEQIKYPFFDRHDTYYGIDNNITFTRTANAWIYISHKLGRVSIETIGTKKKGSIKSDLTNHASYTMDIKTYESMKDYFIKKLDDEKILDFPTVISYFRKNKDNSKLKRVNHVKTWKNKIKDSFYMEQEQENTKNLCNIKEKE